MLTVEEITTQAASALGKDIGRLCFIDRVEEKEGEDGLFYLVYTTKTICFAGEEENSPRLCTYTLGAMQGFLEAFLNKRLKGKQIESVLRCGDYDVLKYIAP